MLPLAIRCIVCGVVAAMLAACSLTQATPDVRVSSQTTTGVPEESVAASASASAPPRIVGTLPGRLLYVDGGQLQLYANGSTTTLTDDGTVSSPAWSPDGSRIAVARRDEESFSNVYVLDDQGETVLQVTDIERSAGPRSRESVHEVVWADAPAWSPDGETLAFLSQVRPATTEDAEVPLYEYPLSIFQATIDEGDDTPPADVLVRSSGPDLQQPAWSPNGDVLAYVEAPRDPDEQRRVMIYDVETEETSTYPGIPANTYDPVWSPDGSWLAFTAVVDGQTDVWVVAEPEQAGEPVRLTTTGTARAAAWSPDGRTLAVVQIDGQGANMFALPLENENNALRAGEARQITTSGTVDATSRAAWTE